MYVLMVITKSNLQAMYGDIHKYGDYMQGFATVSAWNPPTTTPEGQL